MMHYLHLLRTDPSWYLQKLWWTAVLFGLVLIFVTALRNGRRRKAAAEKKAAAAATQNGQDAKPDPRSRWGSGV